VTVMRRKHHKTKAPFWFGIFSAIILMMGVGYAAFQTNLNINVRGNIGIKKITPSDLKNEIVTSGDGLYKDANIENRYYYRGANPNNYITFNNETWRIVSLENDGTLKIIKNDSIGNFAYDNAEARYSTVSTDFCTSASGCKLWGSKTTTLNYSEAQVSAIPLEIYKTTYNLPDKEASLNTYLNTTYYSNLNETSKELINNHIWNIGLISGV